MNFIMLIDIIIFILAIYRISFMLAHEDGPFRIFDRLRQITGVYRNKYPKNMIAGVLECPLCLSVWLAFATTVVYWYNEDITVWLALPFALSGGAVWMIQYGHNRHTNTFN